MEPGLKTYPARSVAFQPLQFPHSPLQAAERQGPRRPPVSVSSRPLRRRPPPLRRWSPGHPPSSPSASASLPDSLPSLHRPRLPAPPSSPGTPPAPPPAGQSCTEHPVGQHRVTHRSIPLLHQLDTLKLSPPAMLVHVELSGACRSSRGHDIVLNNVLGGSPEPRKRVGSRLIWVRRLYAPLSIGEELVELLVSRLELGE